MNWKYKYIGMALLATCVICSCSEDDDNPSSPQKNVENIELGMVNVFRDINVSSNNAWKVTKYPSWAAPLNMEGAAGEALNYFAEANEEEYDRIDTLVVSLSDGTVKYYAIKQLGSLHDSQNGEVIDASSFSYICGVGYGIDVIANKQTIYKYYINSVSPFNWGNLIKQLKKDKMDETIQEERRYVSHTENISGNSTDAISNQLAVNGKIDLALDAFKLNVKGGFSSKTDTHNKHVYAMQEIMHVTRSRYISAGALRTYAEQGSNVFAQSFLKEITKLKQTPNNESVMASLVKKYGTHIVTYGAMGGELQLFMDMTVTDGLSETDINGALDLSSKVLNGSGEGKYSEKEESIKSNTSISLKVYGGSTKWTLGSGASFDDVQNAISNKENMDAWIESLKKNDLATSLIEIETIPLWELMPTAEIRENLRKYIVEKYQPSVLKNDFTPRLYCVSGFDVTSNEETKDSLEFETINQTIKYVRSIVPELSKTAYSTLLYSGSIGKFNMACGFFVGDADRKPCKVYFDEDGKVKSTIEIDVDPVTEVYLDAIGNVTIKPQSDSTPFSKVSFKK